jgi:NADH-quinone oxidoreductase subunit E
MWTDEQRIQEYLVLSEEEKSEIASLFEQYKFKQAACIEAMKIVQERRGWISDDAIRDMAEFFNLTPAELDSVATFYSFVFRRPVGRHVIYVCDSVSCWVMGFDRVVQHIKKRLGIDWGETSADGKFTLLPAACIGACERAPAMFIDDKIYGNLDEKNIDEILSGFE